MPPFEGTMFVSMSVNPEWDRLFVPLSWHLEKLLASNNQRQSEGHCCTLYPNVVLIRANKAWRALLQ